MKKNRQLSFLESAKILKDIKSLNLSEKKIFLISSCELSQLDIYLKALYVQNGFQANIKKIEFGTLRQILIKNQFDNNVIDTLILLTPWDFVESLNWRTGFPKNIQKLENLKKEIKFFYELCKNVQLKNVKFLYFECESLQVLSDDFANRILKNEIRIYTEKLQCMYLDKNLFSISNFLSTGFPFKNKEVGKVAFKLFEYWNYKKTSKKIIFLDLDNTLWNGVLGESGVSGIEAYAKDNGYGFFIFQSFLKCLKNNGILLAIVSKNDLDLIYKAFEFNNFLLQKNDFVKVIGTYEPKSLQIKNILKSLNILEDASIFIDDNELEIKEVSLSSNKIICEQYPQDVDDLPSFINKIKNYFDFRNLTDEDKKRTDLYKLRLNNLGNKKGDSQDLDNYLKSLEQKLNIKEGNKENIDRAVQLLNKTNQFNLNGIRRTKQEILEMIEKENKIFIGELIDKNGSHGEIVVLLIDKYGYINSFAMSCRVFQRKVEYGIFEFLRTFNYQDVSFKYIQTERNHPFLTFAENIATKSIGQKFYINLLQENKKLFNIKKVLEINLI